MFDIPKRPVIITCIGLLLLWTYWPQSDSSKFSIDYRNGMFLKNGEAFRFVSGSLHYFRVPHQLWHDRLLKLRASGINVVSTYVAWNVHEPHVGRYDFEGDADLIKFIKTAQNLGLLVNIRPGPYICSEWDLGGLPYFVLGHPKENIIIRSHDKRYLSHVGRYFSVLLPKLKPLLFENGGPIILVQVENEYGSSKTCDHKYMDYLTKLMRFHLGENTILYTADGWDMQHLICGPVHDSNVLTTLNFGPNTDHMPAFNRLRFFQKRGPLVNSEYYPGWLDHWSEPHQTKTPKLISSEFERMLTSSLGEVYVNFYMFFGGTNFGFYNGANMKVATKYQPDPTSYDYDAPMTECGDITEKYFVIRDAIMAHRPGLVDPGLIHKVRNSTKKEYGTLKFVDAVLFSNIKSLSTKTLHQQSLLTFEELQQDYGFVLYEISVKYLHDVEISIDQPRDRVSVFTDGVFMGKIYRNSKRKTLKLSGFNRLSLLVENMGRINYGDFLHDYKGILGSVKVGGDVLSDKQAWDIWCLPLNNTNTAKFSPIKQQPGPGSLLKGSFQVHGKPADTWINMDKFTKGVLYINDKNVGRYWPSVGPQKHLYVPSVWLHEGTNYITLFEVERMPAPEQGLTVKLVDYPNVG